MRYKDAAPVAAMLPVTGMLIVFFFVPLVLVLRISYLDPGIQLEEAVSGANLIILYRTVLTSVIVAAASVSIGYPVAYIIYGTPERVRDALMLLVLITMWVSVLVRIYAWIVLLGREGVVNTLLRELGLADRPLQLMYTSGAVYLGMVQMMLPYAITICFASMIKFDRRLVRAARTLGATQGQAFRRVFFPNTASGLVPALTVTFMLSIGFFVAPGLLGGPRNLMTANLITTQIEQANWSYAAMLGVTLLGAALTVMITIGVLGRLVMPATPAGASAAR